MPETDEALRNQADFWSREARNFDAIYSGEKSLLDRALDRVFRRDMYQRFEFTMEHSRPYAGRRFLDVGCGTGRFSIELARRGAEHVTGIDVSDTMVDAATRAADEAGVSERCTWIHGDLSAFSAQKVDVSIAIGLFDYVADPLGLLREMRDVTTGSVIASFPRRNTWRAPVRKVRLALRGCPVYFFTRKRVREAFKDAGFRVRTFERVGKLYCVVADCV